MNTSPTNWLKKNDVLVTPCAPVCNGLAYVYFCIMSLCAAGYELVKTSASANSTCTMGWARHPQSP